MNIKKNIVLAAAILMLSFIPGCASQDKVTTNIESAMAQVQNLDYAGAINSFDAALSAGENPRLVYRGKGIAYMGLTDYAQAVENFKQSLLLSTGIVENIDFDLNYYLAAAYYKNGDVASAEKTYSSILALRPNEVNAHFLRGSMRLAQGKYENAVEDFDVTLSLTGNDVNQVILIYQVLEEHGYVELGAEYLQKTLDENGSKLKAYDKGRLYYYLKDYGKASNLLEESKDGQSAEAYLYLGKSYEATGDYNYAASVYNSYIAKDSGNAEIYNQLGLCEMQRKDYNAALNAFQTAMKIEGNGMMQTLQFNEIITYEYLGDFKKAAVLMDNYVLTYPDDEKAKREYEFLKTR